MPKLLDFTGEKIGMVTVLSRAPSKNKSVWWSCRCDCGAEFEASSYRIKRNTLKSCGCVREFRGIKVEPGRMACEMTSQSYPEGRRGTDAGYQAHLKANESACADCAAAHKEMCRTRHANLSEEQREVLRVKNREAVERYKALHPDRRADTSLVYRDTNRQLIRDAKSKPCADCEVQYPFYVMQFDHVHGVKEFNIGTQGPTASRARLLAEIDKCDIVCANCHFERTHQRLMENGGRRVSRKKHEN